MKLLILISFLLSSCTSSAAPLAPEITDAATLDFIVEGVMYDGIATVPAQSQYIMNFKIPEKTQLFVIHSCNREIFVPIKPKQTDIAYVYKPLDVAENDGACPLIITIIDDQGKKIWGFIDFVYQNRFADIPKVNLEGTVFCNGKTARAKGASVCQARGSEWVRNDKGELVKRPGDIQVVGLYKEAIFAGTEDKNCNAPVKQGYTYYKIEATSGKCVYLFGTKDGEVLRLTMLGYKGVNP